MTNLHQTDSPVTDQSRRDFMILGAAGSMGVALGAMAMFQASPSHARDIGPAPDGLFATPPMEKVRMAFVGVGGQGSGHVRNFLNIENVEIKAVCDIEESRVKRIQDWVEEKGQPRPTGYSRGDWDFMRLYENEDVDLIFIATPWRWHVPQCVEAMRHGKHAAVEVPAAYTVDGCWQLVEAAEKHQKHCVQMENCNYDRVELMILNMVRKGLFGDLLHAECGYLHDLRGVKFAQSGEGLWRREHSKLRNGNLYTTHGLGPVAQCMNINRGDQFDFLVSVSSPSMGLQAYQETLPDTDPRRKERYILGDVNTTLIKTKKGLTITLVHDTNLPRPYSRKILVQGVKGIVEKYPSPSIHIEGRSSGHNWEPLDDYAAEFEHPLWTGIREQAAGAGHGGMDYIEDYRLIQCLLKGEPMDMDVYDAAALSVIGPLSENSVADRGRSQDIPDFTRGKYKNYPQVEIVTA